MSGTNCVYVTKYTSNTSTRFTSNSQKYQSGSRPLKKKPKRRRIFGSIRISLWLLSTKKMKMMKPPDQTVKPMPAKSPTRMWSPEKTSKRMSPSQTNRGSERPVSTSVTKRDFDWMAIRKRWVIMSQMLYKEMRYTGMESLSTVLTSVDWNSEKTGYVGFVVSSCTMGTDTDCAVSTPPAALAGVPGSGALASARRPCVA
mmetsp:Transcript_107202/g.268730  ORF Transcript_107202/g.268730 Transcript_107202/m.268730 type:complete len:200 (-) Transcript_107202:1068-1667(-)